MEARNLAIMLTDIKGFTSKTSGFSRAQTQEMLTRHRDLVLPVILKFGGRLVKTIGDAFLVVFNSPTDAVICGVEIQSVLRADNAGKPQADKIEIRIAINAGEVAVHDDGDIYGDPVNITSRLESIAEAGEVFFTESVYLSMNKKEVPSSEIGYRQFKGIPEKIKVFRVLRETPVGAQPVDEVPAELHGPEAAPAAAAGLVPGAGTPAGFWRRLGSLGADVFILAIVLSTFGLLSCGANVKNKGKTIPQLEGMKIKDVNFSKKGLKVSGEKGEKIVWDKDGTSLIGRYGKPIPIRNSNDTDVNVGGDAHKAPLNMVIWTLYCALMLWRFGATAGMKIFKLKAVDFATGGPLPADKAFLRALFSLVSLVAFSGYIWAAWEKDHRTWHDIIAGSRIVRG